MGKKKLKYGKKEKLKMQKRAHEEYIETLSKYGRKIIGAVMVATLFVVLGNIVEGALKGTEAKLLGLIEADDTVRVVGTASEYQLKVCKWAIVVITIMTAAKTVAGLFNVITIKMGLLTLTDAMVYISNRKGESNEPLTKLEAYYSKFIKMLMSTGAIAALWITTIINQLASLMYHVAADAIAVSNIIGVQSVDSSVLALEKCANVIATITGPVQICYILLTLFLAIASVFKELMGIRDFLGTRI